MAVASPQNHHSKFQGHPNERRRGDENAVRPSIMVLAKLVKTSTRLILVIRRDVGSFRKKEQAQTDGLVDH